MSDWSLAFSAYDRISLATGKMEPQNLFGLLLKSANLYPTQAAMTVPNEFQCREISAHRPPSICSPPVAPLLFPFLLLSFLSGCSLFLHPRHQIIFPSASDYLCLHLACRQLSGPMCSLSFRVLAQTPPTECVSVCVCGGGCGVGTAMGVGRHRCCFRTAAMEKVNATVHWKIPGKLIVTVVRCVLASAGG